MSAFAPASAKIVMSWLSNAPAPKVNIRPRYCLLASTRGLRLRRSWTSACQMS
jgi:hypothetical protein